jgi:branched-chain amino acid transport system ATP-binding protein
MLELDGVNAYYESSHVLHDVTMRVEEGSLVTLVGRNGAGKTTTLKSVMGLVETEGAIRFRGTEISDRPPNGRGKLGISLIPEGRGLFPGLTVMEHLRLGYIGHEHTRSSDSLYEEVFDLFPRLAERRAQEATTMSGGEQQMLAIARGLMSEPDLLLVDEPTEGLMPTLVDRLRDVLVRLNDEGLSMLLVEQDVDMALDVCDYGYVIDEGVIRSEGTRAELRADEEVIEQYLLLGAE